MQNKVLKQIITAYIFILKRGMAINYVALYTEICLNQSKLSFPWLLIFWFFIFHLHLKPILRPGQVPSSHVAHMLEPLSTIYSQVKGACNL